MHQRSSERSLRTAGSTAIAAGLFGTVGLASGFLLAGDVPGDEHPLHWVSHLMATPVGVATVVALWGVLLVERSHLGLIGLAGLAVTGVASLIGGVGGALVGWAGGVQEVSAGGLYDLGHRIGDVAAVGLAAHLALSVAVARRACRLPRWSGWLPLVALPAAVVAGLTLGGLGLDGGMGLVLVLLVPSAQLVVWGSTMRGLSTRLLVPVPAETGGHEVDLVATPVPDGGR